MIERQRTESQPLSASTDTSETGSAQGDLSDSQSSANSGVTKHDCGSSANSATSMSDSGADSNELKSRSVKSGSTTASTSGQSDSGAESLYPKNEHTALKAGYTTEDDDTVINVQERETAITDDDSEVIEAEQLNRHTSSLNESVDTEYIKKLKESLEEELTGEEFKELADKTGFDFGESFRLISHAWRDEDRALVQLSITEPVRKSIKGYIVHPCIIDACLQACIAIKSLSKETRQVIPIGIETIRLNPIRNSIKALYGYTEVNHATPDTCDLKLFNQNGDVIMYMHGFKVC